MTSRSLQRSCGSSGPKAAATARGPAGKARSSTTTSSTCWSSGLPGRCGQGSDKVRTITRTGRAVSQNEILIFTRKHLLYNRRRRDEMQSQRVTERGSRHITQNECHTQRPRRSGANTKSATCLVNVAALPPPCYCRCCSRLLVFTKMKEVTLLYYHRFLFPRLIPYDYTKIIVLPPPWQKLSCN